MSQEEKRTVKKQTILWMMIALILCFLMCFGCATAVDDQRPFVSNAIQERVAIGLPPVSDQEGFQMLKDVSLDDGLSEDEAIAIALWNNAQFQADLAQLGLAKADLQEAGMIKNPALSLLFPVGPKQMEWTLSLPIDLLWQRPLRVAYAELNADQVAQNMVRHGLGLVKDVLTSYADLIEAQDRVRILQEETTIHKEIVAITESRLRAGDISEMEAIAIRLAAAQAEEELIRSANETVIKKIRLKTLLGMVSDHQDIETAPEDITFRQPLSEAELLRVAYAARPDMRAAELAIEAAGKSLSWERSKIWNLTASLDANEEGSEGSEMGPGIQTELPLFYWNEGGRTRAKAEMDQAVKGYLATRHQIARDVREAYHNYLSADEVLTLLRRQIIPDASKASDKAEKTYLLGDISYLAFLDFKQQLLDARLREAEAAASIRRAEAQLRYSVGFRPSVQE
jgi:cobalt-zinc-cadmium efflux system outer membrane protein